LKSGSPILEGGGCLLLAFALSWPALYNGQPFFFPDTTAYIRGADAGMLKITKHATPWSETVDTDSRPEPGAITPTNVNSLKDKTVLAGRSPYYGALLYVGEITGGFWLSVYLQALSALIAILLVLRAAGIAAWANLPFVGIVLAATSSLPFYASMLMPDLYAAVTILGCAALIAVRDPLRRIDYGIWALLLTAALTFHDSHKLIAAGMLVLSLAWNTRRGWANWRGLLTVTMALGIAVVAQFALNFGVTKLVGAPPLHPPFLMARVIDDGPGYRYLKATCPGNGFAVCQFVDRLPMNAERFLWGTGNSPGVFAVATPEMKRLLAKEQLHFVFNVLKFDPAGEVAAAISNAGRQLTMTGLDQFQYGEEERAFLESKVPAEHLGALRLSRAYRGALPIRVLSDLDVGVFIAAALFLMGALLRGGAAFPKASKAAAVSAWIIAGILINGVVCGMLSGPFDRYSVRIQWLLPFAALLIALEIWPNRFRYVVRASET
jgi:hypothetical protein